MNDEILNHELKRGLAALIADILVLVVLGVPGFIWMGNLQARVEKLEQERIEQREDLKEILRKIDDIRDRLKSSH